MFLDYFKKNLKLSFRLHLCHSADVTPIYTTVDVKRVRWWIEVRLRELTVTVDLQVENNVVLRGTRIGDVLPDTDPVVNT